MLQDGELKEKEDTTILLRGVREGGEGGFWIKMSDIQGISHSVPLSTDHLPMISERTYIPLLGSIDKIRQFPYRMGRGGGWNTRPLQGFFVR